MKYVLLVETLDAGQIFESLFRMRSLSSRRANFVGGCVYAVKVV